VKKSRFTGAQIVFALKPAEPGISGATFCTWRRKYGGIPPSERKHMRQPEEENLRLKKRVAGLSPDRAMLQDVPAKKT